MKENILKILIWGLSSLIVSCDSKYSQEDIIENKTEFSSESRSFTYEYPTVHEIMRNNSVLSKMYEAWQAMNATVNYTQGRKEVGFYIYKNHTTKELSAGEFVYGPLTPWGKSASVDLGVPRNNLQVCGCFHCHTPLSRWSYMPDYEPPYPYEYQRFAGPSEADINFANSNGIPGIVFDYLPDKVLIQSFLPFSEMEPVPIFFGPESRSSFTAQ